MRCIRTFIVYCLCCFWCASAFSGEMIARLDGKVLRVEPAAKIFVVEFIHPATNERSEKIFQIDATTGFKRVKSLEKIKPGDLATVDYKVVGDKLVAVYVDLVPVNRSVVSASEIASSISKIKTLKANS